MNQTCTTFANSHPGIVNIYDGYNAFTMFFSSPAPVMSIPVEQVQEYEPGKRRRLPDIDKSLPLEVQQAQRRQRKKLQMAESRRVARESRGRV